MSMYEVADGYYDDEGKWQVTKLCFTDCGDSCTCQPPFGLYYSKEHDKRIAESKENNPQTKL